MLEQALARAGNAESTKLVSQRRFSVQLVAQADIRSTQVIEREMSLLAAERAKAEVRPTATDAAREGMTQS